MSLFKSARQPGRGRVSSKIEIAALVVLLAVAAFFRLTQLNDVPPGMTHDEAAFGAEAETILSGQRPIYFALGYGHEPLYAYLLAGTFALLGRTLLVMRLTNALCGLLVVGLTYLVVRRVYGRGPALISAAWMAVAFWPVSMSRYALRAITLPMIWLPAAWLFWEGLQVASCKLQVVDRSSNPQPSTLNLKLATLFALSGLFLGLSFYTYYSCRVSWLVFPLFGLYLLLRAETRHLLRRVWPGFVLMLALAGLIALPLVLYLRAHPASEIRFGLMMEPVRELLAGKPDRVLRHVWNAVRVFSWVGDPFWAYNIPGRPFFHWTGSILFYLGLAVALWRWRDARYAFLILWLGVGMAPGMVTTNEGISFRTLIAQPATYLLVAVGTCAVGSGLRQATERLSLPRRWTSPAWGVLAAAVVLLEGALTYHVYFADWPSRPQARNIYNHNMVAISRYLRGAPVSSALCISALYPLYYHDPWIFRYVSGRDDLRERWFDGRGAIVYPGESGTPPAAGGATYVFSTLTALHPALRGEFEAQASLIERRVLDARDQNPAFEVWRWQGRDALAERLEAIEAASLKWVSPEVQFTQPDQRQRLESPALFGDLVALIGYRIEGQEEPMARRATLARGETVTLVTYWRALRTAVEEDDWKTFVHLLDVDSRVIGGVDVLNAPPTGWLPGDVVVQAHTFRVVPDAPSGEAYVEVGVYRHKAGRLPVLVNGEVIGDRVLLAPVTIEE